jgi:putative FmdB family regulatory protein
MPLYDFKCHQCGKVSELLLSGQPDSKKPACPDCGSQKLEKLISSPRLLRNATNSASTCCGRSERCETPPCSTGERCRRH